MALKDIFSIKQNVETKPVESNTKITFQEFGKKRAEEMGGSPNVILPALHAAYHHVRKQRSEDEAAQNRHKKEIQSKIDIITSNKDVLEQKHAKLQKDLDFEEKKIDEQKAQRDAIRKDPYKILNEKDSPIASYIIGLIIIAFLTIYLFVFYYSAFFKEFTSSKIGIATAIFDAQAFSHALHDGIAELILILTIPSVFLGLGYLIHKFSSDTHSKSMANKAKIAGLMVITFAFDAILAYEITEKIYELIRQGSFDTNIPPFSIRLAAQDIHFWTIIFSGFVVYIIWGLVFNFVMDEYYKLDKVKVTLEALDNKITQYKKTCTEIKTEMDKIYSEIKDNEGKIKSLQNDKDGIFVSLSNVKLEINNFTSGWLAYMEYKGFCSSDKDKVSQICKNFLAQIEETYHTQAQI